MNDEQDPQLDPEQEERVRALLADLGRAPDAVSMPPEVVARLDETLAGLVAEREEADEPAGSNVVPLRRRWSPRAAAAAAAVIVVGAGGVAVANLGGFGGFGGNEMSTADKASSGSGGGQSESLDNGATGTPAPASEPGALSGDRAARLPSLSAASFDSEVARLVQLRDTTANERKSQDDSSGNLSAASCPGPKVGDRSTTTQVLYDGTRAVLVIHPERRGQRLVEAWTCTGDHVLDRSHVEAIHDTSGQSSPGNPGLGSPNPTP